MLFCLIEIPRQPQYGKPVFAKFTMTTCPVSVQQFVSCHYDWDYKTGPPPSSSYSNTFYWYFSNINSPVINLIVALLEDIFRFYFNNGQYFHMNTMLIDICYVTSWTDWKNNPFWRWDMKDVGSEEPLLATVFWYFIERKKHLTKPAVKSWLMGAGRSGSSGSECLIIIYGYTTAILRLYGIFKRFKESDHIR